MASGSARPSPVSAATFTSSPGSVKGTKSGPSGPCATPSPWAPSRSILTSSSMAGADQNFLVAAAARNWGGHLGKDLPSGRGVDEGPDLGHRPPPGFASRTMPPLPTASRPNSNCGFTSATSQAPGAASLSAAGSALVRLIKLTSATIAPTGPSMVPASRLLASVPSSATTRGSPRNLTCNWSLPTSTAKTRAPALQQHLGEASGRGANIERDEALRVEAEAVQRGCELEPAAGDEGRGTRRRPRGLRQDRAAPLASAPSRPRRSPRRGG